MIQFFIQCGCVECLWKPYLLVIERPVYLVRKQLQLTFQLWPQWVYFLLIRDYLLTLSELWASLQICMFKIDPCLLLKHEILTRESQNIVFSISANKNLQLTLKMCLLVHNMMHLITYYVIKHNTPFILLPHKVKTQYLHLRSHTEYFLFALENYRSDEQMINPLP